MAQRPPLPFPTCSQLDLMSRCPASFWGARDTEPRPVHDKFDDGPADLGSRVHSCIERGFANGRSYDNGAALSRSMQLDCFHEYSQAQQTVLKVIKTISQRPQFQSRPYYHPQRAMVMDRGGYARVITDGYANAGPKTILGGTADLVVMCHKGCCFVVVDWKTGYNKQAPVETNMQMHGLALLTEKTLVGSRCVGMIVAYTSLGIVQSFFPSQAQCDPLFREVIQLCNTRVDSIQQSGTHCFYCKRKTICESFFKM